MAEGARLESVFRGNSNVGSNPTLSASTCAEMREGARSKPPENDPRYEWWSNFACNRAPLIRNLPPLFWTLHLFRIRNRPRLSPFYPPRSG